MIRGTTARALVFVAMGGVLTAPWFLPVRAEDCAVRGSEVTMTRARAPVLFFSIPALGGLAVRDVMWVAAKACGAS